MSRGCIATLLLLLAVGCQSTAISTVWKTPDALPPPFAKIAVLVVNSSPAERRAGEDELVRFLKPGQGVAGYTLLSEEQIKNRDAARAALSANAIDGAIVLRLVSSDTRSTYHPPTYHGNYGFNDYYDSFASSVPPPAATVSPGYIVTDRIIHTEISIYAVETEKLLWAAAASTTSPDNVSDLVKEIARASAAELKKQGMIK